MVFLDLDFLITFALTFGELAGDVFTDSEHFFLARAKFSRSSSHSIMIGLPWSDEVSDMLSDSETVSGIFSLLTLSN